MSPDALHAASSDLSSDIAVTWARFGVSLSTATTQLSLLSHVFVADSSTASVSLSSSSCSSSSLPSLEESRSQLGRITGIDAAIPLAGNTGDEDSCWVMEGDCLPDSDWMEDGSGLKRDSDNPVPNFPPGEEEEPVSLSSNLPCSSVLTATMGGGGAGPFSREDRFSAPSDSFFVT